MKPLEKFYQDADAILKRMDYKDAVLLIQLAGMLSTEARDNGIDMCKAHEKEMNRIKNL